MTSYADRHESPYADTGNPNVHKAAQLFADKLTVLYGAAEVGFIRLPASGTRVSTTC